MKLIGLAGLFLLLVVTVCPAKDISALQIFYLIKQAFTETQEAHIFITPDDYKQREQKIKVASAQMQIKINVHLMAKPTDLGNSFKKIKENELLVIFDSEFFNKNSTKLYILSKCKDEKILLVTTSKDYGDSGALLCVYVDENNQPKVCLNLTKNTHFKNLFTEEIIQKAGIHEVVM